jgi:hypothetical protein
MRLLCSCGDVSISRSWREDQLMYLYRPVSNSSNPNSYVDAIILRASRPNVQDGVTSLGVVCETKDGVSKWSVAIGGCIYVGLGEYGRNAYSHQNNNPNQGDHHPLTAPCQHLRQTDICDSMCALILLTTARSDSRIQEDKTRSILSMLTAAAEV